MSNPFVDVVITRDSRVPTQAGFGTPLVWVKSVTFPGVRSYSSLTAVLADFASSHEAYKLASFLFSQDISPEEIKITNRPAVGDIEDELAAVVLLDNDWYALLTDLTVDEGTDDATDMTDLAAFIEGLGSTNPKLLFYLVRDEDCMDPEVDTDIAYVLAALGYDRTVICYTRPSVAQTRRIVFSGDLITDNKINGKINGNAISEVTFSSDHATTMGLLETAVESLDGVASATVTGTGNRTLEVVFDLGVDGEFEDWAVTAGLSQATVTITETVPAEYSRLENRNHAAWVGGQIAKDPGSITWKFKELKGIIADSYNDTESSALEDKKANIYRTIGGLGVTSEGVCVSGEFIDVIHGLDFVKARMQENVYAAMASEDKIPYTDAGVAVLAGKVQEILNIAVAQDILRSDPAPEVITGLVADQTTADRAARYFPAIEWTAELAGAVHKVQVRGSVTV